MSWRAEVAGALVVAAAVAAGAAPPDAVPKDVTSHLAVDEARYRRPLPEPESAAPVTRADYLSLIRRFHRRYAPPRLAWLRRDGPDASADSNLEAAEHFAFFHRATGDREAAARAVAFVERAHLAMRVGERNGQPNAAPSWRSPIRMHRIWRRLEGSAAFAEKAREQLRELMVAALPRFPERFRTDSPDSRGVGLGVVGEILLHYVPEAPDAEIWRPYVERVWAGFRRLDDTTNNTTGYDASFMQYLIDWIDVRDAGDEVYGDPDIQRLFERYMLQVLPIGSLPHYGDTTGWNVEWGQWIQVCEMGARITGDGRFRWAAHRLFQYGSRRIEDLHSWSYTGSRAVEALMEAYRVADESIAPSPPTDALVVLERHAIERTGDRTAPFVLRPDEVPSKVVFRSDATPQALALTLDLVTAARHNDPPAPSNLVALVDRGSVLLMDQGYNERELRDHNVLLIEDYEGFPLRPYEQRVEVTAQTVAGPLLYAAVRIETYAGYPVDLERRVVVARNRAVLVVDRVRFRKSFRARLGPVYNLRVLGPEAGEDWVNSYMGDLVPVRGIGSNKPVLARWRNPARDLLIRFRPLSGAELHVVDRRPDDATIPLPYRVQYRSRVSPRAGETVTFAAVLLPHRPLRHPSALASDIRFAEAGADGSVAAHIPLDGGGSLWLSAGPIQAADFATDADAAAVVLEDERIASLGLAAGSRLEVGGARIVHESTRRDVSR